MTTNAFTVDPQELADLLALTIPAHHPVLITGAPGVGKTQIVKQAAKLAGAKLIISHPVVEDPTDAKGLPMASPGDTEARFLPFGHLAEAMRATELTLWFLDDLGQANNSMQAAYMQLILGRELNGQKLPDHVTFVAATNRRVDRAGVSGILEPVKSRFVTIVELETDVQSWSGWALDNGIPAMGIAFLRFRSDLLSAFTPSADLTNSPMPRTWENLFKLEALGFPPALEAKAFAGAVGQAAANEYITFRAMAKQMVNIDAILMNPDKAKIPTRPNELYATVVGLASRANDRTMQAIATYATRLFVEANKGEYAALLAKDSARREPSVVYTEAYTKLNAGPLGQLISGR